MAKIVLIGAGSVVFGTGTIKDLLSYKEILAGSELCIVDTNPEKARLMTVLAGKMNDEEGAPFTVRGGVERREFLDGADYVVTSPAVERELFWKKDWEICKKWGLKQSYGENGGPGGLSLTLRNVILLMSIFRDVEKQAPGAMVINFSNPEAKICTMLDRYTSLPFVGLCHGIYGAYETASKVLGLDFDALDIKAAGINHFTWIYDIVNINNGRSILEEFYTALDKMPEDFEPLSRMLLKVYGMYPTVGDQHLTEFLAYGYEFGGLGGRDFAYQINRKAEMLKWLHGVEAGTRTISEKITKRTRESVSDIIAARTAGTNRFEVAVDIRNNACISNLPADAIVEVPGVVSKDRVRGLCMGSLPEGIAGMIRRQLNIQTLSVEAALTGDRNKALQAMLAEPVCESYTAAEGALNELLEAFREYIHPGFFK